MPQALRLVKGRVIGLVTRATVVLVVDSSEGSEAVPGPSSVVSAEGSAVEEEVSPSSVVDRVVEAAGSRRSGSLGSGLPCSRVVWVGDAVPGGDVVVGSGVVVVGGGFVVDGVVVEVLVGAVVVGVGAVVVGAVVVGLVVVVGAVVVVVEVVEGEVVEVVVDEEVVVGSVVVVVDSDP